MSRLEGELERAVRLVAEARMIVARQKVVVQTLRWTGHDASVIGEDTLEKFVSTLKTLEDHERWLRAEIKQRAELRREMLKLRHTA